MSISVTVSLADTVQVDVSTDANYSPDVLDDCLLRAGAAAVSAWDALDTEDTTS